jgi:hypothetical protein
VPNQTSRLALAEPLTSDAVDELRLSITANAQALDGAVTVTEGTISNRPSSGSYYGQTYYATDTGQWSFCTSSAWVDVGPVPVVTAFPVTPYDGQEIRWLADSTNGVVWHFRYRAASSSTYKWEFVGGPPLLSDVDAAAQVASTGSYQSPSSGGAGPSITLPSFTNGGDFDVEVYCQTLLNTTTDYGTAFMSYAVGATAALDADAAYLTGGGGDGPSVSMSKKRRKTAVSGGTTLTAQYKVGTGLTVGETEWVYRGLFVTPVRVG